MTDDKRPVLAANLTGKELKRWYWLKDELTDFARSLGIRATGNKELLTQRIAAHLNHEPFVEPKSTRSASVQQLEGPLTEDTVIPVGQRCSQVVRAWFVEQVGTSFAFDGQMRAFFADTDGTQTMQDALDHYRTTRGRREKAIDAQFEYNRFTRTWYETNPSGSRDELLLAWQEYRHSPVDQRGQA